MRWLALAAVVAVALFWPVPEPNWLGVRSAHAGNTDYTVDCFPKGNLEKQLTDKYDESVVSWGIATDGVAIFQLWRNLEKDTWTIVRLDPKGFACLMAAGESWMPVGEYF